MTQRLPMKVAVIAGLSMASLSLTAFPVQSAQAAETSALDLSLTNGSLAYSDPSGQAITVRSDVRDDSTRTIEGTRSTGEAVTITEYFSPPVTNPDPQTSPPDGTDSANYTENSNVDSDAGASSEVADAPATMSEQMVPSFATAVTPTTATLTPASSTSGSARIGPTTGNWKGDKHTGLSPDTEYEWSISSTTSDGQSLQRSVPVRTNSLPGSGGGSSGALASTAFIHKTFIPDDQVSMDAMVQMDCNVAGTGKTFKGDNRTWATPGSSDPSTSTNFRTLMYAKVSWGSGTARLQLIKRVQPTKIYQNGRAISSRTATMKNMLFQEVQKSQSYAQVRFNHSGTNPFCIHGAITYTEMVRFYKNGTLEVLGSRYPVPRHEAYGQFNRSNTGPVWYTQFRLENQGFNCLVGACGREKISFSKKH